MKYSLKAFPSDKILMIQTPKLQGTDAGGGLGAGQAQLTECWGLDLRQTHFHLTADGIDMEDGSVDACITAQPIELPAIDYEAIRDLFDFDI